jgi:prevent-host-death family protein
MPTVGVRELKNQATRIVRSVREEQTEYVITVNGEPVALLRPFTAADAVAARRAEAASFLADLGTLAEEVGQAWRTRLTAADAVAGQRR